MNLTLRRNQILRKKYDFNYLRKGTIIEKTSAFTCIIKKVPSSQKTKVAFTVSKKYFRRANKRNRAKRIMKEAYRKQQTLLQEKELFILFIAKLGIANKNTIDLENIMSQLFKKAVTQL